MGHADYGFLGHPHIRTPRLDALCAGGVAFRRAYAQSPICTPSRATMLTGDQNIVDLEIAVQFKIKSIHDFEFKVRDPEETLVRALRSIYLALGLFAGTTLLAIVLAVAEAHGGRAEYRQSERLGGACFSVVIPGCVTSPRHQEAPIKAR